MKTVVEFGVRGGAHCDNFMCNTIKQGETLAMHLVHVLGPLKQNGDFFVCKANPRVTWHSDTHFVAVSLLDGVDRGSASHHLWKKP